MKSPATYCPYFSRNRKWTNNSYALFNRNLSQIFSFEPKQLFFDYPLTTLFRFIIHWRFCFIFKYHYCWSLCSWMLPTCGLKITAKTIVERETTIGNSSSQTFSFKPFQLWFKWWNSLFMIMGTRMETYENRV